MFTTSLVLLFLLSFCLTPSHILKAALRVTAGFAYESANMTLPAVCVWYLQQTLEFEQL